MTFCFMSDYMGLALRCKLVLIENERFPVDLIADVKVPFSVLIYCCVNRHVELMAVLRF